MCRWMNGDGSFVSARTKGDAIGMVDEWHTAEGAEISGIRDFTIDFRLNAEDDLEFAELGASCHNAILGEWYPRLLKDLIPHHTLHPAAAEGTAMLRKTVEEERARSVKPTRRRSPQPRRPEHCRRRWVPLRRTRIEPLKRWRPLSSKRLLTLRQ
jgi:hypothetical protein